MDMWGKFGLVFDCNFGFLVPKVRGHGASPWSDGDHIDHDARPRAARVNDEFWSTGRCAICEWHA